MPSRRGLGSLVAATLVACGRPAPGTAEPILEVALPRPAPQVQPVDAPSISARRFPDADRGAVVVHGTVFDYTGRPVEGARVGGAPHEALTDRGGRFTVRVARGARLSAQKHDMFGAVTVGDDPEQEVIIDMLQGPM